MGLIGTLMTLLFGNGRNTLRETVEVFRPNAEAQETRDAARAASALEQFAAEFVRSERGLFDRFIDGLNRLPRPLLALGTIGLFVAAMKEPVWFAARMQGVLLIPEPLWWLMGAVVSFYFGARHQTKVLEFQRSAAATFARAAKVKKQVAALEAIMSGGDKADKPAGQDREPFDGNAAVEDWRRTGE